MNTHIPAMINEIAKATFPLLCARQKETGQDATFSLTFGNPEDGDENTFFASAVGGGEGIVQGVADQGTGSMSIVGVLGSKRVEMGSQTYDTDKFYEMAEAVTDELLSEE